MQYIASLSFQMMTYTPILARLKAGFLLNEILHRSQEKSTGSNKVPQKFWMYSAHDTTIVNVLNSLGLFEVSQRSMTCMKRVHAISWVDVLVTNSNILFFVSLFSLQLHSPPYLACIMFELRKLNNDYNLQIFYRNTSAEALTPLNIPNCGTSCPLSKMFALYTDVLPDGDFETECRLSLLTMTYEEADLNGFQIGKHIRNHIMK